MPTKSIPLVTLQNHKYIIRSLVFSPDATMLASLSILNDKRVVIWDTETWQPKLQFYSGPGTTELCFSPDSHTLVGVGDGHNLHLWNTHTGVDSMVPLPVQGTGARYTTRGELCVLFCDKAQGFYNVQTEQVVHNVTQNAPEQHSFTGHLRAPLDSCGWVNPDLTLFTYRGEHNVIHLWDIVHSQLRTTFVGHADQIIRVHFHPTQPFMASTSDDGVILLWNVRTGALQQRLQPTTPGLWDGQFNPRLPILAVTNEEDAIELWTTDTGNKVQTLTGHAGLIEMAFSPDGNLLASGTDDDFLIRIWRIAES